MAEVIGAVLNGLQGHASGGAACGVLHLTWPQVISSVLSMSDWVSDFVYA